MTTLRHVLKRVGLPPREYRPHPQHRFASWEENRLVTSGRRRVDDSATLSGRSSTAGGAQRPARLHAQTQKSAP